MTRDLFPDRGLVVVMGLAGSGKSAFIADQITKNKCRPYTVHVKQGLTDFRDSNLCLQNNLVIVELPTNYPSVYGRGEMRPGWGSPLLHTASVIVLVEKQGDIHKYTVKKSRNGPTKGSFNTKAYMKLMMGSGFS